MAGKSNLTRTDYQAIVTAYREVGDNASQIARMTGRNRQTITRALRRGWPDLGFPPIHQPFRTATASPSAGTTGTAATSPTPGTPAATGPDGLSAKQSSARRREEDVILGSIQNLAGSAIVTAQILQKMIEQAPAVLSKIAGSGEDAISPRDYVRLIRELSKVSRETSDSLNKLMAAGRLNTGEAQTIAEHRHSGSVEVSVSPEAEADRQKRLEHLISIHVRAREYAAGPGYMGEEAGIVDVEATPVDDGLDLASLNKPTSLTALRESTIANDVAVPTEPDARRALAARGMPEAQIDRVIERARARAEREGRALESVLAEILATPPGQAA